MLLHCWIPNNEISIITEKQDKLGWGVGTLWNTDCSVCGCSVYCVLLRVPSKELKDEIRSNESTAISRQNESAVPLLLLQTTCYWFLTDMLKNVRLLELVTEVNAIQSSKRRFDHYCTINFNTFLHITIK
jgi:hypothetical protein